MSTIAASRRLPPTPGRLLAKARRLPPCAGGTIAGERRVDKSADGFSKNIRGAVRGLWNGSWDRFEFLENMELAIDRGFREAWAEGAAPCGISPGEYSAQEESALRNAIFNQFPYLIGFAADIEESSKANGGKLGPLISRSGMWANRYNEVMSQAKTMACGDQKLVWIMGPTEHCKTCLKMAGKVKRSSQWAAHPVKPQSRELECGGWRCQCKLEITNLPMSKGPLPGFGGRMVEAPVSEAISATRPLTEPTGISEASVVREQVVEVEKEIEEQRQSQIKWAERIEERWRRMQKEYDTIMSKAPNITEEEQNHAADLMDKIFKEQAREADARRRVENVSDFDNILRQRELLYVNNPAQANIRMPAAWERVDPKLLSRWNEGISEFRKMVGTGTIDDTTFNIVYDNTRKRARTTLNSVYLNDSSGEKTTIHELGHVLSNSDPEIKRKALAFYDRRTKGYKTEPLSNFDENYRPDEMTKRDKFENPYVGRVYKGAGEEIISMGMEQMWRNPAHFARTDPDYFDFMYNLLRGR